MTLHANKTPSSKQLGIPTANIPATALSAYPDLASGVYYGFVGLSLSPSTTQPADNSHLTLSSSASTSTTSTTYPAANQEGNTVQIHPAVLSIGYNPFYANKTRSIEIHILHHVSSRNPYSRLPIFIYIHLPLLLSRRQIPTNLLHPYQFPTHNFYHSPLNLLILGFIRPEYDYKSLESLVSDIKTDCDVARRSLDREGYRGYALEKAESGAWLRNFEWAEQLKGEEVEAVEARELGEGADGKGQEKNGDGSGEGKL